jgi:hypothetical protein
MSSPELTERGHRWNQPSSSQKSLEAVMGKGVEWGGRGVEWGGRPVSLRPVSLRPVSLRPVSLRPVSLR